MMDPKKGDINGDVKEKSFDLDGDHLNEDKSGKRNSSVKLEYDDSEIEEDELIHQRFLKNHEKKENEKRKQLNEENLAAQMQTFKFVSA
jgi:hypothetical protein